MTSAGGSEAEPSPDGLCAEIRARSGSGGGALSVRAHSRPRAGGGARRRAPFFAGRRGGGGLALRG
eukprot:9651674-Lingulodinium_polyedra.AAC.1